MKPIIEVNGLWKEYRRGAQKERYLSLRDSLFKSLLPSGRKETFWALQDVNFNVYPGESLAIVGRNGAGKSTLLKILSRITAPTQGEIILQGRLASLLEVGTGFHTELTGRENIYLNGSILGLSRNEINRQFDAIVEFAGVEAFLDTPLKHYSSGMQLRLAFAVAAHLEPEILVIDEVLAVGDSAFQQKCISKMTEVSKSGRTILFVSHNIQVVKNLCNKGLLMEEGKVVLEGKIDSIIDAYSGFRLENQLETDLCAFEDRKGKGNLLLQTLLLNQRSIKPGDTINLGFQIKTVKAGDYKNLDFGVAIKDSLNNNLIHLSNRFINYHIDHTNDNTIYEFEFENALRPGKYHLVLFLRANDEVQDWLNDQVTLTIDTGNRYGFNNSEGIQGMIQTIFTFNSRSLIKK